MKRQWLGVFLGLLLVGSSTSALSGSLTRPERIERVDRIDLAARSITLDGKTYRLSEKVRWFGLREGSASTTLPLVVGHPVGFKLDDHGSGIEVTEVWIRH